ncbi:C40 family peptidase [Streptomyces tagetis]|uniref:C40 family peptidase n=1 Tax=Streptomyces tagetis TaxID=2820809 RepID=A0A941B582_9ACTN|nr:C40 family peptidase [Streptomyces sp. RG38]MBQ0829992.1 C40 family peptidase [Streptomyces sp. RG38]
MGSHRRLAPSGTRRGPAAGRPAPTRSAVPASRTLTGAAGLLSVAAAVLGAVPASATPHGDTRAEVDRLYTEAERATEEYNRADERAEALRERVDTARDAVARRQDQVNDLRETLGSLAGAQYRSGGLDPALELLLSALPDDYLDRALALDRVSTRQAGEFGQLQDALRRLAQDRSEATSDLAELEKSRKAVAAHKRTVERKLGEARRLLLSLPPGERGAHDRASRSGRDDLPPGLDGAVPASSRAAAALAAARSALGKPYIWGANGPSGFDCSGLIQWSYAQAGISLPRTSQEQRYAGRRVPLSEARPGDLIAYRDDASHIALYAGGGQVIHAPRPGAPVRYDPVGMMPVSSVTRV